MQPPIDGGVVLVTGASSGIGREMARVLAPRAGTLVLVARRRERLDELAAELRAGRPALIVDVRPADLARAEDVDRLADEVLRDHGHVDVLVNNAGLGDIGLFEKAAWPKLEQMITVNVVSLTRLTHRLLPQMLARGRGGVLNVSSGFGLTWLPGTSVYAATKHYVTAFTEALHTELSGTGVVVSQLCPGPVPTEFEEIAGNPVGRPVPGIIAVTAEACARDAISGFSRGKAMIQPGLLIRLITTMGARTPRWMLRLMYRPVGRALRRRVLALSRA